MPFRISLEATSRLFLICLVLAGCERQDGGEPQRLTAEEAGGAPNILLILSDTLRADHVIYDSAADGFATPNLRRLAELGTTYSDVMSVAPISAPSYASLMTGLPPAEHGVLNNAQVLGPHSPVLAEMLRDLGYSTSAVVSNALCSERYGFARGFGSFWDGVEGRGQWGRHVTDEAIHWLEKRDEDRPFFLFTAFMDAHKPYFYDDAPASLSISLNGEEIVRLAAENRFVLQRIAMQLQPGTNEVELRFLSEGEGVSPPDDMSPLLIAELAVADERGTLEIGDGLHAIEGAIPHFKLENRSRILIDNPEEEVLSTEFLFRCHREYSGSEVLAGYRQGVASFDLHLGRLLDHLEQEGLLDDLVVILLADHGEMLGEHQAWNHVDHLYSDTLDIPLIIKAPGVPEGHERDLSLSLLDVHHFVRRLARGQRLVDYEPLHGQGVRIAATFPPEADELLLAVRDSRFRLISNGTDRWILYDTRYDPDETENLFPELSNDPQIRKLVEQLRQEWTRVRQVESLDPDSLDPEELEHLRALGYL